MIFKHRLLNLRICRALNVIILLIENLSVHSFFLFSFSNNFVQKLFHILFRYFFMSGSFLKRGVQFKKNFSNLMANKLLGFGKVSQLIEKVRLFIKRLKVPLSNGVIQHLITDLNALLIMFHLVEASRYIHQNRKLQLKLDLSVSLLITIHQLQANKTFHIAFNGLFDRRGFEQLVALQPPCVRPLVFLLPGQCRHELVKTLIFANLAGFSLQLRKLPGILSTITSSPACHSHPTSPATNSPHQHASSTPTYALTSSVVDLFTYFQVIMNLMTMLLAYLFVYKRSLNLKTTNIIRLTKKRKNSNTHLLLLYQTLYYCNLTYIMPGQEDATLVKNALQPVQVKEDKLKSNKSDLSQDMQQSIMRSHSTDSLKNKVDLADSIVVNDEVQSGEQKQPEQEQITFIPEDYFYDENHLQKLHDDSPIPQCVLEMDGFFGYDSFKRYNPKILDKDNIIYSSGISYTIFNHATKEEKKFYSLEKGGIGCIAVSQSKRYFAVGEMGTSPNVYIYEYPSLKLYRILRKGTQRTYSSICFSNDDNQLVTVGGDPDFLITVWDWKQERLLLKSKAFSQDIYRVSFSQFNQNLLTTSGTGHIRFWKIAQTFTGLKLQGDIAKFGQFELSDVVSYAEFEDGNVLSSSQYGKLLLWQGNLIKSVISIDPNTPCHNGSIQYVRLMGKQIITCGSDGYIRFWDYNEINDGQSDEHFNLFVKPKREFYFESTPGKAAYLNWIQITQQYDFWLVQDANGKLYKFNLNSNNRQVIMTFNSGRFTDMSLSPLNNCCVTTGYDGHVRLFDYGNKRMFYERKFATDGQATCVEWLPFSKKNAGRMIVAGFSDGIVRFLGLEQNNFKLIKAEKVHNYAIFKVKANRQGSIVAVCDTQGSIFLLDLDSSNLQAITPYCLFQTGFKINDMCFNKSGDKLLLACNDGRLHQLQIPKTSQCSFQQSYLNTPLYRSFTIRMMQSQKPKKQDLELQLLLKKTKGGNVDDVIVDQQWQPAPILNATYYDAQCTKILCSVDGKYLGNYYIVDMTKDRPISGLESTKLTKTSFLSYNQSTDMILIGYRNGSWQLRHKYNPNLLVRKQSFDQNYGLVRKISINTQHTAVLVISEDGTMISYKIDFSSFIKASKGDTIQPSQISLPPVILGISQATFADKIQFIMTQQQIDITDNTKFCLQQDKLKKQQSEKMSQAQKAKLKKIKKVQQLQKLYKQVIEANDTETDYLAKLRPEELVIDEQYEHMLKQRVKEQIEETKKVMMWDEYKAELSRKKLQKYFFDQLEFDNFNVKGIKTSTIVSSFKLQKLSPYVLKQLEGIDKMLLQGLTIDKNHSRNEKTLSQFQQSKAQMENRMKDPKKTMKEDNLQVRNKIKQAQQEFQKELQQAESTMGDYKLKSASDYTVPENQRLNIGRKKKHLFLNYQYLFMEKQAFNNNLQTLRLKKRQMVNNLDEINQRLREINKQLEVQQKDILFTIDEDIQLLETDFQITEEDISEHLAQKQKEKDAAKKTGGMGMGGGNQNKEDKGQLAGKKVRRKKAIQKKQEKSAQSQYPYAVRKNMKVRKIALEDEFREIKRMQLKSQKDRIHKQLNRQITNFDCQLDELRVKKYRLQTELTLVQMKLLTYTQEYLIFRDMETYDNQLMTSINNFSVDKETLENSFVSLSNEINQLESVNDELKKKFDDEKKILKQFVYPEDDDMRERIIRYYKIRQRKRIQKLKKQQQIEQKQKQSDQDEDEQQEQESQEESSDEDEFDEDDQEKPDINIIENDHKNFQRVRKICQYDQKIQENQRRKSDLEKQRNQVSNKIKNLDNELLKAEKQLKIYQKKKLLKINQLYVTLPIKTSQVEYLVTINNKSKLQEDFSNAILFEKATFGRLGDRIEELKREKVDIEKKQKNLNRKLSKLTDEVTKASNEIETKRKQYEEKQLLKFGSTFELEKLKELEPTEQVVEMRNLYKKQEKDVSKRIQQIKQELQQRKRQLLEAKRQNTKVITEITDLGNKEAELKKTLDSTNKQLFKNYDVSKKDELEKERQNLKDLIKFLSKEIQDLKTEIGLFKRKGGHIYTMVTSNKKNFS